MPRGGRTIRFGDKCIDCGELITGGNCSLHLGRLRPQCHHCYKKHWRGTWIVMSEM